MYCNVQHYAENKLQLISSLGVLSFYVFVWFLMIGTIPLMVK